MKMVSVCLGAVMSLLMAAPLAAQCLTPATVSSTGVRFTLADGNTGTVVTAVDGLVRVSYYDSDVASTEHRLMRNGVFPVNVRYSSAPPNVIGIWFNSETEISYSGRMPQISPGREWQTRVRRDVRSSDHSGYVRNGQARLDASYRFMAAQEVTLAGCVYTMVPVEVTMQGEGLSQIRRTAYFSDLGFGIETQTRDNLTGDVITNGIVAMRPEP